MPTPEERIAAGQELRKRGRLSQQQDAALQELERRYGMSAAPAPVRAGQRGGMVEEGTISREEYMRDRGGVGFGGRPVPQDTGTAVPGPMSSFSDEGIPGLQKPVASVGMIRDRAATQQALNTPQDLSPYKMTRGQSVSLGINDLNPVRLVTGNRGYEAAMTESLKDNPVTTRLGQTVALTAGGGAQLTARALTAAPKLVAPTVAARFAGSRAAAYGGRAAVLAGTGAADYYAYNALAEAPNIAREQGMSSPTAGQRIDFANSQVFTPGGAISAALPVAGSAIFRGVRGGLAAGKNLATTGSATTRRVGGQTQQVPVANLFTPADIQKRVAGLSGSLTTMTRDDATKAIDMLLKRGFDPDEAEKMVKFLDYAGKSEVPEMLFQIMPGLRKVDQLTVALGTVGGDAQKALGDALGKQAQESPVILRNALRKAMGISGEDFYAMEKGIRADQLSAPAEGYKAAYGKEVSDETWQNQILPQLRTKYGREAVADAADYAEGIAGTDPAQLAVARQLAQLRDALGGQGATPGKVSTQSLDYIDRMLGDMAQGLKSGSGRRELAKGPIGAQRGIRGTGDPEAYGPWRGLDPETGLDAPRRLSAELKTAEEALEFGRKAFRSGTDIETLQDEFASAIAKLGAEGGESETVRGALLMGWLRGAEDEISTATNPQSVIRRIYGSERQREKLLAMMPEVADDAGAGVKGSNTKDIRALVGGKRDDGREMAGMIDRLKRISGDYNRIIGNSQTAQRAEAVMEQGGLGQKLNMALDALLNTKQAVVNVAKAGINVATRPGIYDEGINRELGRLLTARGKAQLLAVIEEIRARQIATGKGPKLTTPPSAPAAGPIRASGFGLNADAQNAAFGTFLGGVAPAESDEERLRNMAIGFGVGGGARRGSKMVADIAGRVGKPRNALAGGTKTQGAASTPQQAARFETPGSPEYEAAVAKGLDMSTPARMARAKEMGFDTDTVLYHGTASDVDAFKVGGGQGSQSNEGALGVWLTPDPKVAETFSDFAIPRKADGSLNTDAQGRYLSGSNILPVYSRLKNPKVYEAAGGKDPYLLMQLERQKHVQYVSGASSERTAEGKLKWAEENTQAATAAFRKELQDQGYDGVIIRRTEYDAVGAPTDQVVIFDPANIRSVSAAFDPDKAASPILTAGAGGGRGPRKPTVGKQRDIGTKVADATAIAALGLAPPAQAQGGGSAELEAANERVKTATQRVADVDKSIAQLEADKRLLEDPASDPRKVQDLLDRRGFDLGPRGLDGRIGPDTRKAIADNIAKIEGEIARKGGERETAADEVEKARKGVKDANMRAALRDAEPNAAGDMATKAAQGAAFLAATYGAYRLRGRAVKAYEPVAKAAARRANALINPGKLTAAKTGPNALNTRAANINEFWKQGGAGKNVPFEVDAQGAWSARPGAAEPSKLFRAPRYMPSDVKFMAGAGVEAGGTKYAADKFAQEADKAEADMEKALKAGDDVAFREALQRKKSADGAEAFLRVLERIGYGAMAGRALSGLVRYPAVRANVNAADSERALLLQAMTKQKASADKSQR